MPGSPVAVKMMKKMVEMTDEVREVKIVVKIKR